jgi:leucyl-tRNA synthetase
MRMKGFNVFEPQGYDSFGLPAENYAIKNGVHPTISIAQNIKYMRQQLHAMGAMWDFEKEVVTSDPIYYKWTQWVFLQLYKKGLAFRKTAPVNWCPSDQTVLANEQVVDGRCERCKSEVTKKDLTQWFFNIRGYAERLLDFKDLDWPQRTKLMQTNWIGKSEGSEVVFDLCDAKGKKLDKEIAVFTTRIDTLFSCAFLVLAPEHPLVMEIAAKEHLENLKDYIEKAKKETDIARSSEDREKTGVFTGAYAVNPANGDPVPVWIADFVLMHYGTGAVFGDAHDERDFVLDRKSVV